MENRDIEEIVIKGIRIGTIMTLRELGLLSEKISKPSAEKLYGSRHIEEWRRKGWITAYPSGNAQRGTIYFKRSEIEVATTMIDIRNKVTENRIMKKIMEDRLLNKNNRD